MAPAGDAPADYFKTVTFAEPQIPVLFNCLGDVKDDTVTIPELLVKQVQSSVFMEDSIRTMASMGRGRHCGDRAGQGPQRLREETVPEVPVTAVETAADVEDWLRRSKSW